MLIESPQGQAVSTERALARFEVHLATVGTAPVTHQACGRVVLPDLAVAREPSGVLVSK